MGVDIFGWIEVGTRYKEVDWYGIVKVDTLLWRNTNAFSCLFGVRNCSNTVPVAAGRGLPPNKSWEVEKEIDEPDYHSHTWITWQELTQVDWDELIVSHSIRRYKKDKKDEWIYDSTFLSTKAADYTNGDSWENGEYLHQLKYISRSDAVKSTFGLVFDLMERLAKSYGNEFVRLVVWFEC